MCVFSFVVNYCSGCTHDLPGLISNGVIYVLYAYYVCVLSIYMHTQWLHAWGHTWPDFVTVGLCPSSV
jgi:hypothetical protein